LLGSAEVGDTVVIADLEAGLGTLTRLSDTPLDVVVVVVEPTAKSLEVGRRAIDLVRQQALGPVVVVANRLVDDADLERVCAALADVEVVPVPDDAEVLQADREGVAPLDAAPASPAVRALVSLADRLVA
jgi:CO dehydrogenase maturation factor